MIEQVLVLLSLNIGGVLAARAQRMGAASALVERGAGALIAGSLVLFGLSMHVMHGP